jgi:CO dehydrogenase/acetyl-CoA synthase beta subunit
MIVLDMKGVSLKTLTTHSLTTIITALLKDLV